VALAEELTILQIRGSELCLVIVAPPPKWGPLPEGMRVAAAYHTEMAR
jgi:hypothetical protein